MKNNIFLVVFLFLVLSFVMPKSLKSQIVEVGATGGLSYYIGDINPSKHFLHSPLIALQTIQLIDSHLSHRSSIG